MILNSPCDSIMTLLMDMAKDPVLRKRKEDLFRAKELKRFGVYYEHDLTLEQRAKF